MVQKRKHSSQALPHPVLNHPISISDIFEDSDSDNDSGSAPFAKKPKYTLPSLPPDPLQEMSQTELEKLSHSDLVEHAVSLQNTLQKTLAALGSEQEKNKSLQSKNESLSKDAKKTKSALVPSTANSSVAAAQPLSPDQVDERAKKLAKMCVAGIKKQMKWQPSCKTGRTRWSFSGVSPYPDVFLKMLGLPSSSTNGKPWKQKKISSVDFENAVGDVSSSARYSILRITSADVNVKWSPDTHEFSLSGTYGI